MTPTDIPDKPFSPAADRNRDAILRVLQRVFADRKKILEIGSGTGQHAVHFGAAMPWLIWQTSDLPQNHPGIRQWLEEARVPNVLPPRALDVAQASWPVHRAEGFDAIFSANTCHILHWDQVQAMFDGIGRVLAVGGMLVVYGPFNIDGRFTGPGNAAFDASLREADPGRGIRDRDAVDKLARQRGLRLQEEVIMPADNRLLVWVRDGAAREE